MMARPLSTKTVWKTRRLQVINWWVGSAHGVLGAPSLESQLAILAISSIPCSFGLP